MPLTRLVLQPDDRILHVQPGVDGEGLGDDEQRVCKGLDAQLGPPAGALLDGPAEVRVRGDLEGAGAGDEGRVFEGVLDGAETVADGVADLGDGVRVGTWGGGGG